MPVCTVHHATEQTCDDEASTGGPVLHHDSNAGGVHAALYKLSEAEALGSRPRCDCAYGHKQGVPLQQQGHPKHCTAAAVVSGLPFIAAGTEKDCCWIAAGSMTSQPTVFMQNSRTQQLRDWSNAEFKFKQSAELMQDVLKWVLPVWLQLTRRLCWQALQV